MHDDFKPLIQGVWKDEEEWNARIVNLQDTLRKWNKNVFGHIFKRKKKLGLMRFNGDHILEKKQKK